MNYLFLKLLYDCKNIALANDDILLAVELDLGAGVLAGDDLLALLDLHLDFLAINDAAGADLDDLRYLRLFLSGCGQNDTACGGLLCLYHFNDGSKRIASGSRRISRRSAEIREDRSEAAERSTACRPSGYR